MEIKTKYNIFDEVFIMYDNEIRQVMINGIKINIEYKPYLGDICAKIIYIFNTTYSCIECSEDKVFKTKKELIKSL